MEKTLGNVVVEYIEKITNNKYDRRFNKNAVKNLFIGNKKNSLTEEKNFIFLHQDGISALMELSNPDLAESIRIAVRSSLKMYPKNKKPAIAIYKDFLEFIDKYYGLKIDISFPEWLPSNSLERQLHMVKLLHDTNLTILDLQNLLYVSDKTIENDLKKLQGEDEDPLEVLGQKLTIDFDRRNRQFPSTVHPLFLTFNLTQVITMLEGLKKMAEDSAHKNYAVNAAKTIWAQLSDYARQRVYSVSEGLGMDIKWYQALDPGEKNLFYSETMCSSVMGRESILFCYKNGKPCYIEYLGDDGTTIFYKNYWIKTYIEQDILIVDRDGNERRLNTDRVIKAALTEHELY